MALALIGDPDLIFLDEPTTGFDPEARREAWTAIDTMRDLGKTIVLTTHYMEEAQRLADHVAVFARRRNRRRRHARRDRRPRRRCRRASTSRCRRAIAARDLPPAFRAGADGDDAGADVSIETQDVTAPAATS